MYFIEHTVQESERNIKRMKSWENKTWHFMSVPRPYPRRVPPSEKFGNCPGIRPHRLLHHFFSPSGRNVSSIGQPGPASCFIHMDMVEM